MKKFLSNNTVPIKLSLKILISLGLLILLFQKMDIEALKNALSHIHPTAWIGAILFLMIQLFLLSLRWFYLINVGRKRMTYPVALQVTLASNIANLLFLATISGMVVRVAVALQLGTSLFKALFATAIDRIMTLASLVLICALFLPSLAAYVEAPIFQKISIFVAASILFIFIILPVLSLKIMRLIPIRWISKANMRSGLRYLTLLFKKPVLLFKIVLVGLFAQVAFFLSTFVIINSLAIPLTFLQVMTVLPAIAIVSSIPISFGGWGVREGAFVYGLGLLGVSMENAFSISIQVGVLTILGTVIAGFPALIWKSDSFNFFKTKSI